VRVREGTPCILVPESKQQHLCPARNGSCLRRAGTATESCTGWAAATCVRMRVRQFKTCAPDVCHDALLRVVLCRLKLGAFINLDLCAVLNGQPLQLMCKNVQVRAGSKHTAEPAQCCV
jgi:hypothetical protein